MELVGSAFWGKKLANSSLLPEYAGGFEVIRLSLGNLSEAASLVRPAANYHQIGLIKLSHFKSHSLAWSLARSLVRRLVYSLVRSLARSLARSFFTVSKSHVRSLEAPSDHPNRLITVAPNGVDNLRSSWNKLGNALAVCTRSHTRPFKILAKSEWKKFFFSSTPNRRNGTSAQHSHK